MTYTFPRQHTTCGCVCGRCFWQGGRTTQVGFDCLLLLLAWRLRPIWQVCSKFFMARIRIMQLIMIRLYHIIINIYILYYIILYYIILHYIILYYIFFYILYLYYIIFIFILYYIYIILYLYLYYIIFILYYILLYYIILYYIILYIIYVHNTYMYDIVVGFKHLVTSILPGTMIPMLKQLSCVNWWCWKGLNHHWSTKNKQ